MTGYPSKDKPWLKYYSKEQIEKALPDATLYEYIKNRNQDNLDRTAINYYGKNISYRSLFKSIDIVASALEGVGVKRGDIVTICMINSPETVFLLFALNKIGAVANMIYVGDTTSEICEHINDARSSVVFVLDIFQDKILEIIDDLHVDIVVTASLTQGMSFVNRLGAKYFKGLKPMLPPDDKRFVSWNAFIKCGSGKSNTVYDSQAPAVITYTGGTTGGSKGVILNNTSVLAVAEQYVLGEDELYRDSKWMQVLPLFIAYGVTCSLMIPLIVGMTIIIRIPMSESIAELCKKFKPNHIMYSPAFWEAFADENRDLDLSYLIAPISGGDTLNGKTETKIDAYLEKCGSRYKLMNGYGMTEVGAAVSVNYKHAFEFGSVGTPFVKNIVSAFDPETGEELPYGKEGEICIYTPSMMKGYLNNKDETDNIIRIHGDGLQWVHSGDLGYISENGFIHISGRLKRYTLSFYNGIAKKIFSLDIEKALLKHPDVAKVAVVPKEDKQRNQVPVAFVILADKTIDEDFVETSIRSYANENLEFLYRPVEYHFTDKYPLTKVGKVDYKAMEDSIKGVN